MIGENSKRQCDGTVRWPLVGLAALAGIAATLMLTEPAEAKKRNKHHYYGPQNYGPQTSFSGKIVARRYGRHGNVSGVVLNSGVVVHFPRYDASRAGSLRVGQSISGTGYWTYKREGRVIAPTSLNR